MKRLLQMLLIAIICLPNIALAGFGVIIPGEKTGTDRAGYFFKIHPGNSTETSITVFTTDDSEYNLLVYGADGRANPNGRIDYLTFEKEQLHIGKWVEPLESNIVLSSEGNKEIPFKIIVPENTPPGDYAGAIAVTSVPKDIDIEGRATLQSIVRTIVPIYVSIPGEKIHSYEWNDFYYEYNKPHHTFYLNLKNTGNTIVGANLIIEISDKNIGTQHTITKDNIKIPQGESLIIPIKWGEKPFFGSFNVKATATFTEFDITTGGNINPEVLTKTFSFNVIPWGFIYYAIGILILIIAAIISWAMHSRRIRKESVNYTVQVNDTVDSLARKYNFDWELLVKINKIRPPYNLTPGSKILLPRGKNVKR
jgi:hypothetical protein